MNLMMMNARDGGRCGGDDESARWPKTYIYVQTNHTNQPYSNRNNAAKFQRRRSGQRVVRRAHSAGPLPPLPPRPPLPRPSPAPPHNASKCALIPTPQTYRQQCVAVPWQNWPRLLQRRPAPLLLRPLAAKFRTKLRSKLAGNRSDTLNRQQPQLRTSGGLFYAGIVIEIFRTPGLRSRGQGSRWRERQVPTVTSSASCLKTQPPTF
jgi:hypothetical protein